MKVLLTIEEYRERALENITSAVRDLVRDEADEFLKWKVVSMLTDMCLTNEIMAHDQINFLYHKTFCLDRDGNPITEESIRRIDKAEVDEFNAQIWYVELNEKRRKEWKPVYEIRPFDENVRPSHQLYNIERTVLIAFVYASNTGYYLAMEAFKRLYGHEFEYDRECKFRK